MTERIYTRDQQGQLEPLEEERFAKEEELQALIAEHPEVLDGEQMRPGAPLRWILIAREQGIAESSDAAARWAVDHLLVDQDAVPTLVEVKRGSNPEIRRTIVGQMLEYAAHAARTWTADTLRHAFEESVDARGLDPSEELGKLLTPDGEGEPDADGFWERVATNLAAARLRLLFVADDIPDPVWCNKEAEASLVAGRSATHDPYGARKRPRRVVLQLWPTAAGATQRCFNPGFSERIGNSRRTGSPRGCVCATTTARTTWLTISNRRSRSSGLRVPRASCESPKAMGSRSVSSVR